MPPSRRSSRLLLRRGVVVTAATIAADLRQGQVAQAVADQIQRVRSRIIGFEAGLENCGNVHLSAPSVEPVLMDTAIQGFPLDSYRGSMPPLPYRGPSSQRHGQNAIRCLST